VQELAQALLAKDNSSDTSVCCAVRAMYCLQLHFAQDAGEKPVEIFHRLKLYADDDPTGQTRKPVVSVSCSHSLHCHKLSLNHVCLFAISYSPAHAAPAVLGMLL
jgi:hypothetical protein